MNNTFNFRYLFARLETHEKIKLIRELKNSRMESVTFFFLFMNQSFDLFIYLFIYYSLGRATPFKISKSKKTKRR